MKKLLIIAVAVAACTASFAQVFDMPGGLQSKTISFGGDVQPADTPTVVYSAMTGPYVAFPAATGSLGFDDYSAVGVSGSSFTLSSMRFIGGVTQVGQTLQFDFFNAAGTSYVGGFTSTFGSAGNFIWSITGLSALNLVLPKDGILQISAINGATGQWFLSATTPTVGTSRSDFGGTTSPVRYHQYELTAVPEPSTYAALGLGALALLKRRNRKA